LESQPHFIDYRKQVQRITVYGIRKISQQIEIISCLLIDMYILGISAFYHDSAASLLKDGVVITAVEEERFTRIKHDNSFPYKAIEYCLVSNNLSIKDINYVAYYEKPLLKFERILETFVETYPFSLYPFIKAIPEWLGEKIKVGAIIKKKLGYKGEIYYIPHHLSHASAAFFTSPFKRAAILTVDGVGDVSTTDMWMGELGKITNVGEIFFPNSLGLFYSTLTAFLGFRVNSDEYKVMGLGAYGNPTYKQKLARLIKINDDGSFELDLSYFAFRESFRMWSRKFESEFGSHRNPGEPITQRHKDMAASLQVVTEDVYFGILNNLYKKTHIKNLCISGGVALNSLANGKIYKNTKFRNIYDFGPAGDSGTSLGAALFLYTSVLKHPRPKAVKTLCLGSEYAESYIEHVLEKNGLKYEKIDNQKMLIDKVAHNLKKNDVIGWFQGRMEFGPRALGSRSILANPKSAGMKDVVNKIKKRESFRPFAASVLQEKVQELFDVPEKNHKSPYMNFCFEVKDEAKRNIAAIVHEDGTCRIQTVCEDNGLFYKLIKRFYFLTGIPCLLNTSFNLSVEPIVEKPEQAIYDFTNSSLDVLVIGNFIVTK
jgi:carbamoyltransferase